MLVSKCRVPFGENCRYDLVVDRTGELTRVQCKTGRLRHGAVRFSTASTYGHLQSPHDARRHYIGQIAAFAVYCPETDGVYLIPIGEVLSRSNAYLFQRVPKGREPAELPAQGHPLREQLPDRSFALFWLRSTE